jgi:hypothetical protein
MNVLNVSQNVSLSEHAARCMTVSYFLHVSPVREYLTTSEKCAVSPQQYE